MLELHLAAPRTTLMPLSCSPNFPRAQYLDICTLTHEPIVKCDKSCSFGIGRRFVHGKFYTMLKKIKSQKESTNVHDFFAEQRPGRQEK